MAAPKTIDFVVSGDPERAKSTVEQALTSKNFKVTWQDEWTGQAERGAKTIGYAGDKQYVKLGLHIMNKEPGQTVVQIDKLTTGWAGGAMAASKAKKNFASLKDELSTTFQSAGVLISVETS